MTCLRLLIPYITLGKVDKVAKGGEGDSFVLAPSLFDSCLRIITLLRESFFAMLHAMTL